MNKEDKERLVKLLGQNKLTRAGSFALHTYIRDLEDCNKEKEKEIERLKNREKYLEERLYESLLKNGKALDFLEQIINNSGWLPIERYDAKTLKNILQGSDK